MTTAQRRTVVREYCGAAGSERRACRWLGVPRATLRYASVRRAQPRLLAHLRELALRWPRWGSARLTWRMRQDGWCVNHKRIERVLRLEHLLVRQRPRKKRPAGARVPVPAPVRANERWSMDFVRDVLADGRPFRVWTLVDDATRECPFLLVARSLPAARVIEALEYLRRERGTPCAIVCDNGPEFASREMDQWASAHAVRLAFIEPGRPVQNAFVESFNGKLRDECLNVHHFLSLADAQRKIEAWRVLYNTARPHQGLKNRTPEQMATLLQNSQHVPAPQTL